MLSGIGPAKHLQSIGIAPVVDLQGVGENLQDHLDCAIRLEASQPNTLTPYIGLVRGGMAGARYLLSGGGPASSRR
jgi:choline dehydrogenase-like flavoprotein